MIVTAEWHSHGFIMISSIGGQNFSMPMLALWWLQNEQNSRNLPICKSNFRRLLNLKRGMRKYLSSPIFSCNTEVMTAATCVT